MRDWVYCECHNVEVAGSGLGLVAAPRLTNSQPDWGAPAENESCTASEKLVTGCGRIALVVSNNSVTVTSGPGHGVLPGSEARLRAPIYLSIHE